MSLLLHRAGVLASGGAAAWTPANLFAASETGAWYDPSDLSTLYTDDGVTNVTTDGDLVYRMDDKSGNGLHVRQTTSARRPLYKTSAGLHWLQFDGVDDYLASTGAAGIGLHPNFVIVAAQQTSTVPNFQGIVVGAPASGNDYDTVGAFAFQSSGGAFFYGADQFANSVLVEASGSGLFPKEVSEYVLNSTNARIFRNGTTSATDASITTTAGTVAGPVILGARYISGAISTLFCFAGTNYGTIIRGGVTTTDDDRTLAREYLAAKAGVTL